MEQTKARARWPRWAEICLVGAALTAAVSTFGWARAHRGAKPENPLSSHLLPAPTRFEGRVVERLDAGSYTYLRVARDGAPETWVVALGSRVKAGDHVRVDAVGRASRFHSKRLGRDFHELFFAAVRAA